MSFTKIISRNHQLLGGFCPFFHHILFMAIFMCCILLNYVISQRRETLFLSKKPCVFVHICQSMRSNSFRTQGINDLPTETLFTVFDLAVANSNQQVQKLRVLMLICRCWALTSSNS